MSDQASHIIPFPQSHRGDPDPRRFALASIGFQYQQGIWRRGRVVLTDDAIDQMDARSSPYRCQAPLGAPAAVRSERHHRATHRPARQDVSVLPRDAAAVLRSG
jgi:hypothetical protein